MRARLLVIAALLLTLAGVAFARPGGGEGYSGGGGHSGGGGGDIGAIFELVYWVIRLTYYYPQVGLPLLGGIAAYVIYSAYKQHKNKDWDSGPPVQLQRAVDLMEVRRLDPEFSQPVFEDFAFRLFATAHRARHSTEALVAAVGPYLDTTARAALTSREPTGVPVEQVIVGAMRVFRADVPNAPNDELDRPLRVRVGIEFEANILTRGHTYYTVETWLFGRDARVHSKPPGAHTTFPCPNCGAPWQATSTGSQKCAHCEQVVDNGRFDWIVEIVGLQSVDERPPTLTNEVPERGTDLPTYKQRDVMNRLARLKQEDPEVDLHALNARLELIFRELSKAWSQNNLEPIRGFVSDGLFDYLSYWVDAYKRQGLRNVMADVRITKTDVAKVVRDRYYHSITIRFWATGKDYVVRSDTGRVVRGSKSRERPYSEYWTLIRSAQRKGPVKTDRSCGNCGAPLEVSMTGACNYCGAHVTGGEFDWILSKIEQDDSYRG